MQLTIDDWTGPAARTQELAEPTAADVRAAIARLDGVACTEVTLGRADPFAYFGVAGGPELYHVFGETADERMLRLTDPRAVGGRVALVCGGQLTEFDRRELVTREQASTVLLRFLEHADHDPELPWEVEG